MQKTVIVPIIVTTLTFLLAGFVKGVIGLGLPTVSMGLLTTRDGACEGRRAYDRAILRHQCLAIGGWPEFSAAGAPGFGRCWPAWALGTLAGTGLLTGSHAGQAAGYAWPALDGLRRVGPDLGAL